MRAQIYSRSDVLLVDLVGDPLQGVVILEEDAHYIVFSTDEFLTRRMFPLTTHDNPQPGHVGLRMKSGGLFLTLTEPVTVYNATEENLHKLAGQEDSNQECDECFGTGLVGGFQAPCSKGCVQSV